MRFVIQRVQRASVRVEGETVGEIGHGLLVLCGVAQSDDIPLADKMVKKLCGLRIFDDENGKTNLSLNDVGGELLMISQFTLYADCEHGNRPSFFEAGKPDMASPMYDHLLAEAKKYCPRVEHGIFGAHMAVELLNDGPFTIVLDSDVIFPKK